MTGYKKKFASPLTLLIGISVLLRVIVYLLLPVSDDFGRYSNSSPLFFSALTEHFKEYLAFTTNIPPATFIIDAFLLNMIGVKAAMSMRAFLILIFILDTIAISLLFRSAKRMGSNESIAFIVLTIFSIALIPFELWRDGMHYDHLTFSFTAFFAWSLVRVIKNHNSVFNKSLVSITGALLVSQSAANSAIVPFSVFSILCFLYLPKKQFIQFGYALLVSLLLPVVVLFMISKKNSGEGQEGLTSNKAGPAMMMVVQRAYKYDVAKVRELVQSNGAPAWYTWTYDHATPPFDPSTKKQAEGWMNLAQAFGICFYSADGPTSNNPWGFNFDPLAQYLRNNGPAELLPIVQADAGDAINRPYLFAGFSSELSPRWIGVYGDVSKRMFFAALKKNPVGMGKAFIEQQGIFCLYGHLFLYNTTQSKPSLMARSGLKTITGSVPLSFLLIPATFCFALIAFVTYLAMLLNIPVVLWRWLKSIRSGKTTLNNNTFLLLSIPAICIAVVYSCLVGGENDRYFIQASPYLVLLSTCLPAWFSSKINK
ncbi:MAG: hypothetical protein ABI581_09815 [Sediminibacterium sp.]